MSEEQLHARDRIVQQMSRDGLIEQNITQDTVMNISSRQADFMAGNNTSEEMAHDRSQNKIYYQAQETVGSPDTAVADNLPTGSNTLPTSALQVPPAAIDTEELLEDIPGSLPAEFAALSNRIADIVSADEGNGTDGNVTDKAERLLINKNERLKSDIRKQKRIRDHLQEYSEEEDEKEDGDDTESEEGEKREDNPSERLQTDRKKNLNFKADKKEQNGLKSEKKREKRLRFDKRDEKEEEEEETDTEDDSYEKRLKRDMEEPDERSGRLYFEDDDKPLRGYRGGRISSHIKGKALRRLEEETEKDMDVGTSSAYRLGRNAVRGSQYLVRKGRFKQLERSNEEMRGRLKHRGTQNITEKEGGSYSGERTRFHEKSAVSEKLKTGSRYHNQHDTDKKKAVQKAYQKKINQQRAIENVQRIEKNAKFIAVVKSALIKIAAAVKSSMAVVVGIVLFIFVILCIVAYILVMLITQGATGAAAVYGGTYQSTYTDISDCEAYFRERETDLEEKIAKIEEEYPDCYEYIYDLGNIGHKAIELISYISTRYLDFTLEMCKEELDSLFEEMYTLTVEIRSEPRERDKRDAAGNILYDEAGNPVKETFRADICYITLTVKPWEEIVSGRLTDGELERYNIYTASQGAQQVYGNPLTEGWQDKISCRFGYRIHPITMEKDFHDGIDIAVPTGTPLYSCTDGTVVIAQYSETAGNYIKVKTESGFTVTYMHLDSLGVSVGDTVSKGMLIGATGNTGRSTGPHLHLEVRTADNVPIDPTFIVANGEAGETEEEEGE